MIYEGCCYRLTKVMSGTTPSIQTTRFLGKLRGLRWIRVHKHVCDETVIEYEPMFSLGR